MTEQPTGLKANLDFNETVTPTDDFFSTLKDKLPQFFTADKYDEETGELIEAGTFDFPRFQAALKENNVSDELSSGYRLDFIGKNLAKKQAGERPTTVIVPNKEHNDKSENKDSKNLFFTGDNLEVLRHLQSNYQNAVDFIYIDPPYNTGSDGFVYPDDFKYSDDQLKAMFALDDEGVKRLKSIQGRSSHSAWLAFMYPRLYLARKLLKETGVIFVSIDENEYANLKVIMDEIYGEGSFIENIIWDKKSSAKGVPPETMMAGVHEYILCFQRGKGYKFIGEERTEEDGFSNPDNDPRGPWRESNIRSTTSDNFFSIKNPETGKEYVNSWAFSKSSLETMIEEGRILWKESLPKQKEFMYEMRNENKAIKSDFGLFDAQANTVYLKNLFGVEKLFSNPKPLNLMKYLISVSTKKDSIILDFFAGSATTADAIMQLNLEDDGNRQYILVQIPEKTFEVKDDREVAKKGSEVAYKAGYKTIDEISRSRIEKAAEKIKTENPDYTGDLGFKHFTVKEVEVNTLDKMIDFNPDVLLVEDLVAELDGGVETLLTTWLTADGYKFDEKVETVKFDEHTAYYIDKSLLYIIEKGWSAKATEELVNALGTRKLNVNTIIVSEYALGFTDMTELKTNVKNINEPKVRVEVRG